MKPQYAIPRKTETARRLGRGKITASFFVDDGYAGFRCYRVRFGLGPTRYFEQREFNKSFRVVGGEKTRRQP